MKKQQAKRVIKRLASKVIKSRQGVTTVNIPAMYSIDSPLRPNIDSKTVSVEGWIIPNSGKSLKALRVSWGGGSRPIPYGLKRADVARAYPHLDGALASGFALEITTVDGTLSIEADFGGGFMAIHTTVLYFSPEKLVDDLYNPDLARNYAEHQNLIHAKKKYFHEPTYSAEYVRHANDPRLVAFYLPQFHPLVINDDTWGKGFTEWTNVTSGVPRFVGHNQPILPADFGFYDLRYEKNIEEQIKLAKRYGIYAFCFYYYWFSGKQILEAPLNSFLSHNEWDFNFSICWANENWTKRWDGRDSEVIIAQEYADDDPLKFIQSVEHILLDPRYVTEDGKPVLSVFRASELKDPARYAKVWREYFQKMHGRALHLVSIVSFEDKDPCDYGFDMAIDFAPQSSFFKNECFTDDKYPYVNLDGKLLDNDFQGSVADYRQIALNTKSRSFFTFPHYKCVTPSWDNDARKKGKGFVMYNESPDIYGAWLRGVLSEETNRQDSPIVFINAWNEWAEGAILEPSQYYGAAALNRTVEALAQYSSNKVNAELFPQWGIKRAKGVKLAVVIHLYYPETWRVITEHLVALGSVKYDLFVTLVEKDKAFEKQIRLFKKDAIVQIVPNRGRDILPFINLLPKLSANDYEFVLKLHSKKTIHRANGSDWLGELLDNLLPDEKSVRQILSKLEKGVSIVGPAGHFVSLRRYMGSDEPHLKKLLTSIYGDPAAQKILQSADAKGYFAGSMFWASLGALEPLRDLYLLPEDFEAERGQIDGTLAHAVERLMSLLPILSDAGWLASSGTNGITRLKGSDATTEYNYAE